MQRYAGVVVDILSGRLDRIFTYAVPESLADRVEPGVQVEVPFGHGNRVVTAFVVQMTQSAPAGDFQVKEILGIHEKGTTAEGQLIRLAVWMKEEYGSTLLQALKTVLPVRQKVAPVVRKTICWAVSKEERTEALANLDRRSTAQIRLLSAMLDEEAIPYETAATKLNVSAATVKSLEEKGILRIEQETRERNPLTGLSQSPNRVTLNEEQAQIVREICADEDRGVHGTYLIHGVTGSGKTEVYMELIAHVLAEGRQAIVLIPEIALTYQTVMRFYRRFGDRVSILNSRLSAGERYDQYLRAERGETQIMVGPRSALFTPFPDLGLIIIDEEHETSYKSETAPRYTAVGVARRRAADCSASVVLGSATPSVESYYRAQTGEYRLFTLKKRAVKEAHLPEVEIVDLREELQAGNRSIVSRRLCDLLAQRLDRGEQSILFLNRRGMAGFMSCRSCGKAIKCPHCDVSLTLHRGGRLICHYCGYEQPAPKKCPSCGSPYIAGFGIGTQKAETMVQQLFPQARILRMDADTTAKKGGHEAILSAFAEEKADILIGTQMIVKGHDFPKVTLVGALAADLSLHASSYDAPERTFQLLTQAAGRAGRGQLPGQVVIQTYNPDHYSVTCAAGQDYEGFYEEELPYRQMLHYPPIYAMMTVLFSSRDEAAAGRAARSAQVLVDRYIARYPKDQAPELIGPCDAAVSKIMDVYHKNLFVRHRDRKVLVAIKNGLEQMAPWKKEKAGVLVQYDISD